MTAGPAGVRPALPGTRPRRVPEGRGLGVGEAQPPACPLSARNRRDCPRQTRPRRSQPPAARAGPSGSGRSPHLPEGPGASSPGRGLLDAATGGAGGAVSRAGEGQAACHSDRRLPRTMPAGRGRAVCAGWDASADPAFAAEAAARPPSERALPPRPSRAGRGSGGGDGCAPRPPSCAPVPPSVSATQPEVGGKVPGQRPQRTREQVCVVARRPRRRPGDSPWGRPWGWA